MKTYQNVNLMISPSPKINEPNLECMRPKGLCLFRESFHKKINEEKKLIELAKRNAKKPLSLQSYSNLLCKLIAGNHKYFTKEYGKTELDFENYVNNTTDIYKSRLDWNLSSDNNKQVQYDPMRSRHNSPIKNIKFNLRKQSAGTTEDRVIGFPRNSSETIIEASYSMPFIMRTDPFIYELSNPEMLKNGITIDPDTIKPIKLYEFETKLTNPDGSWFHPYFESSDKLYYPNRTLCAHKFSNDSCYIYDKAGNVSISFLNGKLGRLIVIYSTKRKTFKGVNETVPLAMFDLNGNGVIYDENGSKRLIYDQAEGILFDTPIKFPLKWKWENYERVTRRKEDLRYYKIDELIDVEHDTYKTPFKKYLKPLKYKGRIRKINAQSKSTLEPHNSMKKSILKNDTKNTKKRNFTNKNIKDKNDSKTNERPTQNQEDDPKISTKIKELVETPAILKFSEGGCCVIEPLLAPCLEEIKKEAPIVKQISIIEKKERTRSVHSLRSSKRVAGKIARRSARGTECFPAPNTAPFLMKISHIKPIVMRITDVVSITIMSQEHIHIDFLCHPMHFMFNIGVTVSPEIKHIYAARNPNESKEPIPCLFEVLQFKCNELYSISQKLKKMREDAKNKSIHSQFDYLRKWGYGIYLKKLPYSDLVYEYKKQKNKPCYCPCPRYANA